MTPDPLAPFCGSVKFMPDLDARIAAAQKELDEMLRERDRRASFTDAERLADRIHNLMHRKADCDYLYSDWPLPKGCRAHFHSIAAQLLRQGPIAEGVINAFLSTLEAA